MADAMVFEREGPLGLITLSRPEALNALNLPMIIALQQQLLQWQADDGIHAVIINAAPGKAFCAGGDVRWLYETGFTDRHLQMQFFWHEYRLNYFISQLSKPYIALMDGMTMGGGVGISLHGSHPVASRQFSVAMPETGIGLFPDIGASFLLSRCPGQLGRYLALTGNRLGADDALAAGLIHAVVEPLSFSEIISRLQACDLSTNAAAKVTMALQVCADSKKEPRLLSEELAKINHYFCADSVKEIMMRLQKSDDPWALNQASTLLKKSPLSLEVTFAQFNKARSLSLADCLKMDYCLVGHFMDDNDFYEGIRALLIDKDKAPHWHPHDLDAITAGVVANYFECEKTELTLPN